MTDIHIKEDEIKATPDVGIIFIDANDKAYLSITGRACVIPKHSSAKASSAHPALLLPAQCC